MVVEVATKDVGQLSDLEAASFGDLVVPTTNWSVGYLSKEAAAWTLVSQLRYQGTLVGFAYGSLERIGGTPAVLFGLISVARSLEPGRALDALKAEYLRRASISFPDEDVVVAARCEGLTHLRLFNDLSDVCPVGGGRIGGEERAWGRRLAKRFQAKEFDVHSMLMVTQDEMPKFDYPTQCPDSLSMVQRFSSEPFELRRADQHVIVWGWAECDYLAHC